MNDYIAETMEHEIIDDKTVKVDGEFYTFYSDLDPQYENDGVLNISYWDLYDGDNEFSNMILVYDYIECEDPQEWSDSYAGGRVIRFI